ARQALEMFHEKIKAGSWDEAQERGRRSLGQVLSDATHWYYKDRRAMAEAIAHMTSEEQDRYRNDSEYKKKIDQAVEEGFKIAGAATPGLLAAKHMLENISEGKTEVYVGRGKQGSDVHVERKYVSPEDIISKLYMHGQDKVEDRMQHGPAVDKF